MNRSIHLLLGVSVSVFALLSACSNQSSQQVKYLAPWKVTTLASYDQPLAHEGPLHLSERELLFFTSNRLRKPDGSPYVKVSIFDLKTGKTNDLGLSESIPMANGAFLLKDGLIAIAMQGNKKRTSGIASYNIDSGKVKIITNGFADYQFNSPNDIVQSKDRALWFTDPQYGYEEGFRPTPALGNWVWHITRQGDAQRLLLDGFSKPNGIALNVDETSLFVTDTGYISGSGKRHSVLPRTIYRFKITKTEQGLLATERTTFAIASKGIPDGIKVDRAGRVWTATGAGLEIFGSDGELLQIIPFEDGVSNFALDEEGGGAFVMGETKLYRVQPQR